MTKLHFIGDLESDINALHKYDSSIKKDNNDNILIQVGDFGLFSSTKRVNNCPVYKGKNSTKRTSRAFRAINTCSDFREDKIAKFNNKVYFIKGDVEDFGALTETKYFKKINRLGIIYAPNGKILKFENTSIGCLGGIFSTKKYYSSSPWKHNDKRFFSKMEIYNTLLGSIRERNISLDILLTHQAPYGVLPKREEGAKPLNWLMDAVKPKYLIHGHHHKTYTTKYNHPNGGFTQIIGLGNFSKSDKAKFILDCN